MRAGWLGTVLLIVGSLPTFAICPAPEPRPCYLFHVSKAVFIGTVHNERNVLEGKGDERVVVGANYILTVHRQFRGKRARLIKVFTANDSGREILDVGKTYMVFAHEGEAPNRLQIWCLDTREVKDIEAAARELDGVARRKGDATLRGETWMGDNQVPLTGATVRIRGPKNLTLTSDKNGRFQAKLPPGRYKIAAFTPDGRLMQQSTYNWALGDPTNLVAEPGQCFDLRFVRD